MLAAIGVGGGSRVREILKVPSDSRRVPRRRPRAERRKPRPYDGAADYDGGRTHGIGVLRDEVGRNPLRRARWRHDGGRSSGVTGPAVTKVIAILGFGPLPPSSACSRRASYRGISCRTPLGDLIFPLSNADRPSAALCRDGRRLPSSVEPIGGRRGSASQRLREATSTGNSSSILLTSRVLGRRANSGAIEGEAAPAETKNTTRPESLSSSRRN
jgi:hypothetical protein